MATVAVIDDEPDICDFVAEALQTSVVIVRRATTAGYAVEMLTAEHFDLALIDVVLPDASGLAVAEIAINENTPVLLMTGDLHSIEGLVRLGFPVLEKPFRLAQLCREAARAIADSRQNIEFATANIQRLRSTIQTLDQTIKDSERLIEISRGLVDRAVLVDYLMFGGEA